MPMVPHSGTDFTKHTVADRALLIFPLGYLLATHPLHLVRSAEGCRIHQHSMLRHMIPMGICRSGNCGATRITHDREITLYR